MSTNCLVTKLKGTVDNDSLKIFDTIKVKIKRLNSITNASKQQKLDVYGVVGNPFTVYTTGDNGFSTTVEGLVSDRISSINSNVNSYVGIYVDNKDYEIYIKNKYNIKLVGGSVDKESVICLDLSEFDHAISLESIGARSKSIDTSINELADCTNIREVAFAYCNNIIGDTSVFRNKTNLEIVRITSPKVTGVVTDFVNCTGLKELSITGSSVTGSLEQFITGQISKGRTTPVTTTPSNITVLSADILKQLTFGGNNYANGDVYTLIDWDGSNVSSPYMAVYVGVSQAAATKIYAKNATQQQITDWQNAGKTVVVIN